MSALVIAEIGASHGGSVDAAVRLAEQAAVAGANVIKGQVGISRLTEPTSPLHDTFADLELTFDEWEWVAAKCDDLGVRFTCSPWSVESVAWLASVDPPFIKVGSGDANYVPTLEAVAETGLPVYVSTGLCTHEEVEAIRDILGKSLGCLLACTVNYPAAIGESYLARLRTLRLIAGDDVKVGYSSHCSDWRVPFFAAQLGAEVLEVHVALDDESAREQGGLLPSELDELTRALDERITDELPAEFRWAALGGGGRLGVHECEKQWEPIAHRDPRTGLRK